MAVLFQTMDLSTYQVDWLMEQLGHTGPEQQQKPNMALLVSREYVAKLLLIQDNNLSSQYKGRKLEDIGVAGIYFNTTCISLKFVITKLCRIK